MGAQALGSYQKGLGPEPHQEWKSPRLQLGSKGWAGTGLHCLPQPPTLASRPESPAVLSSGSCMCQAGGGVTAREPQGKTTIKAEGEDGREVKLEN